jgi:hypothetical protein
MIFSIDLVAMQAVQHGRLELLSPVLLVTSGFIPPGTGNSYYINQYDPRHLHMPDDH